MQHFGGCSPTLSGLQDWHILHDLRRGLHAVPRQRNITNEGFTCPLQQIPFRGCTHAGDVACFLLRLCTSDADDARAHKNFLQRGSHLTHLCKRLHFDRAASSCRLLTTQVFCVSHLCRSLIVPAKVTCDSLVHSSHLCKSLVNPCRSLAKCLPAGMTANFRASWRRDSVVSPVAELLNLIPSIYTTCVETRFTSWMMMIPILQPCRLMDICLDLKLSMTKIAT